MVRLVDSSVSQGMLYRCYREEEAHRVSGRKRGLGWALIHRTVHLWVSEHAVHEQKYVIKMLVRENARERVKVRERVLTDC